MCCIRENQAKLLMNFNSFTQVQYIPKKDRNSNSTIRIVHVDKDIFIKYERKFYSFVIYNRIQNLTRTNKKIRNATGRRRRRRKWRNKSWEMLNLNINVCMYLRLFYYIEGRINNIKGRGHKRIVWYWCLDYSGISNLLLAMAL